MAKLVPVVRTCNDFNTVYIRISHRSSTAYIKTSIIAPIKGVKQGKITDNKILANCYVIVKKYVDKINNVNIENWTVSEIKDFLLADSEDLSFSIFARYYIRRLRTNNRGRSAATYVTAVCSLEKFLNKEIYFRDITALSIRKWIDSLRETARAKQLYPTLIKKLFEEGCFEYNDYDRDIIRIKHQPFRNIIIPKNDLPRRRFAPIPVVCKILNIKPETDLEDVAHDVAMMILCLAGINTVDLYNVGRREFVEGKLCYNRSKEKNIRQDKAYFEITVPELIVPLFDKYRGNKNLLYFAERWADNQSFNKAVNKGLKSLCRRADVQEITTYWLRHTWATVAQNVCGATDEQVAFALNHVSAHRVTRMYIEKDFTPVDTWNRRVIDAIFK